MFNQIEKLASAVKNHVWAGLQGHNILRLPDELIIDSVIDERLKVIYELTMKGQDLCRDLALSINCIPIDCKDLERCSPCLNFCEGTPMAHFEVPLFINGSILFLGSNDKLLNFNYYTSATALKFRKYKKRINSKPYVWIDLTPNENGMFDCYIFNAPLLESVSITAVFKDPRQLDKFNCCENTEQSSTMSFVNNEVVKRLTEKLLKWYATRPIQLP